MGQGKSKQSQGKSKLSKEIDIPITEEDLKFITERTGLDHQKIKEWYTYFTVCYSA